MAHFQVKHDNSRGKYYSHNDPSSVHSYGWNSGVKVELRKTDEGDKFYIWMTTGSAQRHQETLIGVVSTEDNSPVYKTPEDGYTW